MHTPNEATATHRRTPRRKPHRNTRPEPTLPKAYDPKAVESKWYAFWKESGVFHAEPDPNKQPYCITIPPPNITGSLHMGHALNNSVLDTMTRWHRMRGFCHALPARNRPRGHRHAERGGARNRQRGTDPARPGPRKVHRAVLAVARTVRHAHLLSVRETGLLLRLGARALHAGRILCGRGHGGVRALVRARPDLSRHARGELGREIPVRRVRHRGGDGDATGQTLPLPLPVRGRQRLHHHRHHAPGNPARRRGRRRQPERRTLSAAVRQNAETAAHGPRDSADRRRVRQDRSSVPAR